MSLINVLIMSVCCVFACKNNFRNNRNVHYYRFPFYKERDTYKRQIAAVEQRMAWIRALKDKSAVTLENIVGKRVCSSHFVAGEKADCMDKTNQSWTPTIGLCVKDEYDFSESEEDSTDKSKHPDTIPNPESKSEESKFDGTVIKTIELSEIILSMEKYDKLMTNINKEAAVYIDKLQKVTLEQARQIEELKAELKKHVRRRRRVPVSIRKRVRIHVKNKCGIRRKVKKRVQKRTKLQTEEVKLL